MGWNSKSVRATAVLGVFLLSTALTIEVAGAADDFESFACYEYYDSGSYEAGSSGQLSDLADPPFATTGTYFHGNGGGCQTGVSNYDCLSATDLYELDGTWMKYAGGSIACEDDGDDGTAAHLIFGHDDADGNRSLHVSRIYIVNIAFDSFPVVLEVGA